MPRQIPFLLCIGFILWLLRQDVRSRGYASPALLVPGLWLALVCSRPLDFWVGTNAGISSTGGNPVNMMGFVLPMIGAFIILAKRGFSWSAFLAGNRAVFLLYLFYLISMVWSPFPLASCKRIFKDFGCVLMVAVVFSETMPVEAAKLLFVRLAYVLFPLSVVFIKYFPAIGRVPSRSGEATFNGVCWQKNSLGQLVFVMGLFLVWDWLDIRNSPDTPNRKLQLRIRLGVMLIGMWLLWVSDSKTSQICLALGILLFWATRQFLQWQHGRRRIIIGLGGVVCLLALNQSLGLTDHIAELLGREADLSGRTLIWKELLKMGTDPVKGWGFYSFWDTPKVQDFYDSEDFNHISEAHNGYLEAFFDGGLIAVCLLAVILLRAGKRVMDRLFTGTSFGRLAFVFWFLALIYNNSESSFFRMSPLWFTFLLFTMDYPSLPAGPASIAVEESEDAVHSAA
jgi:O-antigen ligase